MACFFLTIGAASVHATSLRSACDVLDRDDRAFVAAMCLMLLIVAVSNRLLARGGAR